MSLSRTLSLILLCCCLVVAEEAAPTRSDWLPVSTALRAGEADAVARAEALIGRFPAWPGTYLGLAVYHLGRGDAGDRSHYDQAIVRAREALDRQRGTVLPVAIQMAALTRLGRGREAQALFDRHRRIDGDGTLHFLASQAALLEGGALDRSERLIEQALALAGPTTAPAAFLVQRGVVLLRRDQAGEAEGVLRQAVERDSSLGVAWYNLALSRRSQAIAAHERGDDERAAHYHREAQAAMTQASARFNDDPEVKLAAGLAALAIDDLASARTHLSVAADLDDSRQDVAIARAVVETRMAARDADPTRYEAALAILERRSDIPPDLRRALADTLITAAMGARRHDAVINVVRRHGLDDLDPVNRGLARWLLGLQAAQDEDYQAAADHLEQALADLLASGATEEDAALARHLGHVHQALADVRAATEVEAAVEYHQNAAAEAYRSAMQLGDHPARRFLLALESRRDPTLAYDASIAAIRRDPLDFVAWRVLVGNYGAAEGWKHPVHLVVWGLLLMVLLIAGLRRAKPPVVRGGERRGGARPGNQRQAAAQPVQGDETLLPKKLSPLTSPLEKGQQRPIRRPSQAEPVNDETLMPQSPQGGERSPSALDKGRKRR